MTIPCNHWRECGVRGGGCCTVGVYERPSFGTCLLHCDRYQGPPRAGIASLLIRGEPLPAATKLRHAGVLTGDGPSPPLYLGSRMGAVIGRVTGRQPCGGCRKVETGINAADQWGQEQLRKFRKWTVG